MLPRQAGIGKRGGMCYKLRVLENRIVRVALYVPCSSQREKQGE